MRHSASDRRGASALSRSRPGAPVALAAEHVAGLDRLAADYLGDRSGLEQVGRHELARRLYRWAAQHSAIVAVEAIIAWVDAGRPDPDLVVGRIRRILDTIRQPSAGSKPGV